MKRILVFALATGTGIGVLASPESSTNRYRIFVGTYTNTASRGIYHVVLDRETGAPGTPALAAETPNPSWIALSPDRRFLYAVHPSQAQAIGFAVDRGDGTLRPLPVGLPDPAGAPSHLALDGTGRLLMTANYGEGHIDIMAIRADGSVGAPRSIQHTGRSIEPKRQASAHPHHVALSPDNRFALVCDLGLDRIFTYAIDPDEALLRPGNPPFAAAEPGAGPRHLRFGADGLHAYVVNEMAGTLSVFDYEATHGRLTHRQTISTLPDGFTGPNTSAEVRLHPGRGFLYVSNRGADMLTVLAVDAADGTLSVVEHVPCGGTVPRNFELSPDGTWLVCANQNSDSLVVFAVDPRTGRLRPTGHAATVPRPTCIVFLDRE